MTTAFRAHLEAEAHLLEFLLTEPLCEKCLAIIQKQYQDTCDQIAEDEKDRESAAREKESD